MKRQAANPRPLETAHDADLRSSMTALRRASVRARELAQSTGTEFVVRRSNDAGTNRATGKIFESSALDAADKPTGVAGDRA